MGAANRRAETARFFAEDPERITRAVQVIEDLHVQRYSPSKVFVRKWLSDEEATAELTAMGPGVLAMVFDNYDNLWHEDRNIFVQVIENVGREQRTSSNPHAWTDC